MYNPDKKKACKQRHFDKVYKEANEIECGCGCGTIIKNKDKYGRDKRYVNGHNRRKYDDPQQHKREWNHRNRPARLQAKKERGQKLKGKLLIEMGGKCSHCKLKYDGTNACVFDLHHKEKKTFRLNQPMLVNHAWADVLEEATHCILLCSNCHRKIHGGEY